MNDENDKIVEQTSDIENERIDNDEKLNIEAPIVETADTPKENPSSDISKVKISDILKQRFKKMKPGLRKALPIILVGIICFAAGIGADRAFIGRRVSNNLRNKPGINQSMQNKRFNDNQGNMKNNENMPNRFNNRIK
jgi:hypothetical protein